MGVRSFLSLVLALMVTVNCPLFAQTETATLSGYVTDPDGKVLTHADVQVVNVETNIAQTTQTNDVGLYLFPNLHPGNYRISVKSPGFKEFVKQDLVLHVQDTVSQNFKMQIGSISESITVVAGATSVNTEDATVSTVVDRNFAENLPLNGRSFQTLIQLTPGVVLTTSSVASDGQFSINGQRATSNYWMVDGVSANIGMSSTPGASDTLSGSLGGFSAQGGTNSLVSVDAMQEFRIQTSTFAPEFGRTPGGQISIVTRSGTNQLHGTGFDYFRNDVLDASDWFNGYLNNPPLRKPEERQNDFGGTFSGPILKNRTFFFFSYEGLRLRLPQTGISTVPDASFTPGGTTNSRQNAVAAMQPFFNAYPLPNGPEILDQNGNPTGTAPFNASYSNRSTLNASSLRIDHKLNDKLILFGRYNYAPSELVQRPGSPSGLALSVLNAGRVGIQTATAGATWVASPTLTNDLRANYSHVSSSQGTSLDNFGGAKPFDSSVVGLPSPYTAQNAEAQLFIVGLSGGLDTGGGMHNLQQQFNIVDSLSLQKNAHALKFGVDYRRLTPNVAAASYVQYGFFSTLTDAQSGTLGPGDSAQVLSSSRVPLILQNLGLFAQDTWRVRPRLTVTYGLRWDVDFTPKTSSGPSLPTVVNFNDASTLALAPLGTAVFGTRYGNVAPRVGIAYQLGQKAGWESVLRGGWGIFYDLATSQFQVSGSAYPYGTTKFLTGGTFPLDPTSAMPAPVTTANAFVFAYDPKLKSPYTQEWNLAYEQSLGPAQSLSASYVGAAGRHLLVGELFGSPNANIANATLTGNYGTSDYDALQLQFQRRLSRGLQSLASYSWAHSIDTASTGAGGLFFSDFYSRQEGANSNRGSSDFDIQHSASVALTYDVSSPKVNAFADAVLQHWSVDNIFQVRSAPPVDVNYYYLYTLAGANVAIRPDVVPGIPLYLYGSQYPGGKGINGTLGAVAGGCPDGSQSIGPFCPPPAGMQGNLGRNALRGFGAWQWDFAAHRDFPIGERMKLQFRAELFNVLNHPNFGQPLGNLLSPPTFGLSYQTLAQSLNFANQGSGGFNPLYQLGGPRSIEFALKLSF